MGCAEEEDGIKCIVLVAADYACCRPLIGVWILQDVKMTRGTACRWPDVKHSLHKS